MRIRVGLAAFILLTIVSSAGAQDGAVDPDRPGLGTNANTVPRGALQLETGVDYARERTAGESASRRTSILTTVRYGLVESLELRLEGEPVVALRGTDDVTNVGDFTLGVKWRLLEGVDGELRPSLALLPIVKPPTAPAPIGTERPDFTLLGLASFGFGRVSVDLNAGIAAIGQRDPDGYLVQALLLAGVGVDITSRLKFLAELSYGSRSERDGDGTVSAVAGVVYIINPRFAIDAAVISAVAGRGPDYRLQAGLTIRFGP